MSDCTIVSGNLILCGSLTLQDNAVANGQGSVGPGSYQLFTYGGTLSGSFTNAMPSMVFNQEVYIPTIVTNVTNEVDINIQAVAVGSFFQGTAGTNYHVGVGTLTTTLIASNLLSDASFIATLSSNGTAASIQGTNLLLLPNQATNVILTLNTTNVGTNAVGNIVYAMSITNNISGTTSLGNDTITYTSTGYYLAGAATSSNVISQATHIGTAFTNTLLSITNIGQSGDTSFTYTEGLNASVTSLTGAATNNGLAITNLTANTSTNTIGVGLGANVSTAGVTNGTVVISFASSGINSGLADTALGTQTITLSGTVYNYASAGLSSNTINLGRIHAGGSFGTNYLSVTNTGPAGSYTENLAGAFTNASNGVAGIGYFTGLSAQSSTSVTGVTLTNTNAGSYNGSIQMVFTSEALTNALTNTVFQTNTIGVTGFAYTGQSYWVTNGTGNWTNFSSWDSNGGTPGLDGALSINDTATFNTNGSGTVILATNASLMALTFSNATASYTINGGGTITLKAGSNAPVLANLAGSNTISTTLAISNTVSLTNDGFLTITGRITGAGSLSVAGSGTTTLSVSNSYTGGTTLNGGTLSTANANALGGGGVALNGGTLLVNSALTLATLNWNGSTLISLPNLISGQILTVSGALNLSGYTNTFNLAGFSPTATPVKVMGYGSNASGFSSNSFAASGIAAGLNYELFLSNNALYIDLATLIVTNTNTLSGSNTYGNISFSSNSSLNIPTNSILTIPTNIVVTNNSSLVINGGTVNAGSNVIVASNNTLGGGGIINGNVINNGTINPSSTNSLVINGNLNFGSNSAYQWTLFANTTNSPGVNYTAPLQLNGSLTLNTGANFQMLLTNAVAYGDSFWARGVTNSWIVMNGTNVSAGTNFGLSFVASTNNTGFNAAYFYLTSSNNALILNYYQPLAVVLTNSGSWTSTNTWQYGVIPTTNDPVVINGGTALLTNSGQGAGNLVIGTNTNGISLVISNGGSLSVLSNTIIGQGSNAFSNNLVINNGSLSNAGNLIIGSNGSSNSMMISGGGSVVTSNTIIGAGTNANSNSLVISGSPSSLSNSGNLYIGSNGSLNSMVISNGATAAASNTYIGAGSNANGNALTINGGSLSNGGNLYVGSNGSSNLLVIGTNATSAVIADNTLIGAGSNANSNTLVISGSNSLLSNSGDLYVGSNGSYNSLVISNGATALSLIHISEPARPY